jgi:hypothetical protein
MQTLQYQLIRQRPLQHARRAAQKLCFGVSGHLAHGCIAVLDDRPLSIQPGIGNHHRAKGLSHGDLQQLAGDRSLCDGIGTNHV